MPAYLYPIPISGLLCAMILTLLNLQDPMRNISHNFACRNLELFYPRYAICPCGSYIEVQNRFA